MSHETTRNVTKERLTDSLFSLYVSFGVIQWFIFFILITLSILLESSFRGCEGQFM